ncbi:MAG TPA: hypothetical protein VMS08_04840 [Candidatus Saccharimonadia bacterium]|nr:hypothetical protein [Candidatus Saccharimonadia bacterium]
MASPGALAASPTLYVGHGAVSSTNTDAGCWSPGYNSVQTAVNSAPSGATVYLCGAQFAEQVFLNKSVTLAGDSTSGLTAVGTTFATTTAKFPAKFQTDGLFVPQALLVVTGNSTAAKVNGITISGPMAGNSGCAEDEYGVLALAGNLSMQNDQVKNIADTNTSLYGCQFGVGIQVGRMYWEKADFSTYPTVNFSAVATLNNVTVSGYQKNGVTVDGKDSSAKIYDSKITGGGSGAPFGTTIAQNGLQVSRGASGNVYDNTISDNAYSGSGGASSAGVLVFGGCGDPLVTGSNFYDNTLVGNDVGIYLSNYNPACTKPPVTATNDKAYDNVLTNTAVTNVSGLCDGNAACGGKLIGYQAGVADVGDSDSINYNEISGQGYATQGTYDFTKNPPVFTQTGANSAFVRPVDAGGSFPTTNVNDNYNEFY